MQWYSHEEALTFADPRKAEVTKSLLEMAGFNVVEAHVDAWCPEDDGICLEMHVVLAPAWDDYCDKRHIEAVEKIIRLCPAINDYWPRVTVKAVE